MAKKCTTKKSNDEDVKVLDDFIEVFAKCVPSRRMSWLTKIIKASLEIDREKKNKTTRTVIDKIQFQLDEEEE